MPRHSASSRRLVTAPGLSARRPLYGDVFGTAGAEPAEQLAPSLSRDNWGAVEEDVEGSDEEEEEDEEEGGGGGDGDTASELSADEVAAGISSVCLLV